MKDKKEKNSENKKSKPVKEKEATDNEDDAQASSIFSHNLIPKHEILSEPEVKELLEKYKIEKSNLPRIYDTDVMVKHIGAKPKDVIKITRDSATSGTYVYYRLVVSEENDSDD